MDRKKVESEFNAIKDYARTLFDKSLLETVKTSGNFSEAQIEFIRDIYATGFSGGYLLGKDAKKE